MGVANEQRFALQAYSADTGEPGLIRKRDGTVWVIFPDGSEVQVGVGGGAITVEQGATVVNPATTLKFTAGATVTDAGGGEADIAVNGGSQPPVTDAINGLVLDYDPPGGIDNCGDLILDPTAQPWQSAHEYSNEAGGLGSNPNSVNGGVAAYVTPTSNPNGVKFKAQENGGAVTGSVEPSWSQDGTTPVEDGTVARPLEWTPVGLWGGAWASGTSFPTGTCVIGNGYAWQSDGGGASGGTVPAWPTTPNSLSTVSDGAITWTVVGPCVVWAAGTRHEFVIDSPTPTPGYLQSNVIPIAAVANTDYVFSGQPIGLFGTSGGTEPVGWENATPADGSVWVDGDILWSEATSDNEKLVLTGLVAPAGAKVLTILNGCVPAITPSVVLEDTAEVVNDYGVYAESSSANVFDSNDANRTLGVLNYMLVPYVNGHWQPAVSA